MSAAYDPEQLNSAEKSVEKLEESTPDSDEFGQLGSAWEGAKVQDKAAGKSLYNPGWNDKGNFISRLRKKKKLLAASGVVGGGMLALIIALFSFLNTFKIDHIMSNIDAKTFVRFNAVAEGRSDKWVRSYITLRLTQLSGKGSFDNDSEYFRANKVDTNSPIRDWYRTLRTSNFEADLAKDGVVFASRTDGRGVKFSVLEIDKKEVTGLTAKEVRSGDLVNKLRLGSGNGGIDIISRVDFDLNSAKGNKQARRVIRQAVNDRTFFYQVMKRRHVRKDIQNMTGVRDWRFFDGTRTKVDNAKINIRNKIITAAVPESTLSGKFIRCLLGMADCRGSVDPKNPAYRSTAAVDGSDNCDSKRLDSCANPAQAEKFDPAGNEDTATPLLDPNGKPITEALTPKQQEIFDSIKSNMNGVYQGLRLANLIGMLEMLSKMDANLSNGNLSKMVSAARGVQAMGLYQTFETARDQTKNGNVNGTQFNQFMQVINNSANSEGWTKVIAGEGDASKLASSPEREKYCKKSNQDFISNSDPKNIRKANQQFHYLCPAKQVGGGSNAATVESAYQKSFGPLLGPISDSYNGLKNAGGGVLGKIIAFGYKLLEKVSSQTSNALISIAKFVGLGESLKKAEEAVVFLVAQVASFLGAGPISNGYDPAGVFFNWALQGGAYTAESTARENGAAASTPESIATAQARLIGYQSNKASQMSVFQRYLALSNPDSVSAKGLFDASNSDRNTVANFFLNITGIFKHLTAATASIFSRDVSADKTNTGYEAANFAGIQPFDFPKECQDLEPLTSKPLDGTNIFKILQKYDIDYQTSDLLGPSGDDWTKLNDSTAFYDYLYQRVNSKYADDPDRVTLEVYNCNILDTAVRGSLGFTSGYTNDNGLQEPSDTGTTQ